MVPFMVIVRTGPPLIVSSKETSSFNALKMRKLVRLGPRMDRQEKIKLRKKKMIKSTYTVFTAGLSARRFSTSILTKTKFGGTDGTRSMLSEFLCNTAFNIVVLGIVDWFILFPLFCFCLVFVLLFFYCFL